MNERIKELAERASKDAGDGYPVTLEYTNKFAEKFAELVIEECVNACGNHEDVESFGIYPIRVAMVTKSCMNNIMQHFGAER